MFCDEYWCYFQFLLQLFQMKAQAYDLGTPQLTGSEVNVTVFVTRNNNPPFFINAPYIATVDETANFGTFVYDSSAADSDNVVSSFILYSYEYLIIENEQ